VSKLNRHAGENQKAAGVHGVSLVGGKVEELWRKVFVEKMSFEPGVEERRVMDGDSGDEGNDELTCVRSDETDKSS